MGGIQTKKSNGEKKCFPDNLSELLISYEKTDYDNNVDNDLEVNFDDGDDRFDITDDEKGISDETWKTQIMPSVAKHSITFVMFVLFFVFCWKTKHKGLWDVMYYVKWNITLLYKCIFCINILLV